MFRLGRRRHHEFLGPHHGYFYDIKRSLYRGKSQFQQVELVDTASFGRVLIIDGITQLFESTEFQYHEPLTHPALTAHPDPRRVLIIGAGDGGILREVVRHACVEEIHMAELDGEVVEIAKRELPSVHGGAFDDPRVQLHIVDGRKYVEENPNRYDVVIMDMTDPQGPSCMLYTREFFRSVRKSFRKGRGLFVMHAESADDRPIAFTSIIRTNRVVFERVRPMYHYVQHYGANWCFLVSSEGIDPRKVSAREIDKRLKKRGVTGLKLYNGEVHHAMLVGRPYLDRILEKTPAPIITDAAPEFPDRFE